jgi:glycosyltransferase involved in cell wall biosynthesis
LHEFLDRDHGLNIPLGKDSFAKFVKNSSLHVIANSKKTLEHFYPNDKSILKNVCYIFPRVTNPNQDQKIIRKTFTIGIIGSFQKEKGHEILFRAVQKLSIKQEIKILVIGQGAPADLKRLRTVITRLGIENIVEFAGPTEFINECYSNLDLVVVPSLFESFGRVGIESIKLRIPVIYSNSGGMCEYMRDGITGLSFIPGDHHDLHNKILLIITNSKLQTNLTESAIKFIQESESYLQNSLFFRKLLTDHHNSSKYWLKKLRFLRSLLRRNL